MKFDALTDEQLEAERAERLKQFAPWEKGEYAFEVMFAEDKLSKASNKEMIEIVVRIWNKAGEMRELKDWLTTGFMHKLKHFCQTTNLMELYESGTLRAGQCMYKTGTLLLGVEKGKPDGKGGMFPDRNNVVDYIAKPSESKALVSDAKEEFDKDVPF